MSGIEKMYENAGVKADRIVCYRGFDNCMDNDFNCHCHNEKPCKDAAKIYPPFTAEKQLKILCFIVNNKHSVTFHDQIFSGDKLTLEKIQENLAWAINRIWQNLSLEEKQQIKEILE